MLSKPSLSSAPLRASLSSRSTVVFAVVAVVALGSTVAAAGLGRAPQGRFDDARAKMMAECTDLSTAPSAAAPAGNPCDLTRTPPPAIPQLKLGQREIEAADAAQRAGDHAGSAALLASALSRTDVIDRSHTLVASLVAGRLIDDVSRRVDADPSLLDDARLSAAIRRTSYASSRQPLASERLHALAVLAGVPAQVPLRSAGLVEATATQAMADVDAKLHAMESALLAKDVARCEQAAEPTDGLAGQVTLGPGICRIAANSVTSREHLVALRGRTMARGPKVHLTTARRL
ncbi:hypothetical protein BH11MYX4_BH11MYX4_63420 [soil metagenome]